MRWSRPTLPQWTHGVTVYEEPPLDLEFVAVLESERPGHRRPPGHLRLRPGRAAVAVVLKVDEAGPRRRRPALERRRPD